MGLWHWRKLSKDTVLNWCKTGPNGTAPAPVGATSEPFGSLQSPRASPLGAHSLLPPARDRKGGQCVEEGFPGASPRRPSPPEGRWLGRTWEIFEDIHLSTLSSHQNISRRITIQAYYSDAQVQYELMVPRWWVFRNLGAGTRLAGPGLARASQSTVLVLRCWLGLTSCAAPLYWKGIAGRKLYSGSLRRHPGSC